MENAAPAALDAPKLRGYDRFQAADFVVNRYIASVPSGTTLTDVLHPQYFVDHLGRMKRGMEITVLSEDMELDAKLRVLSVTVSSAKVRVLDVYAGDAPASPAAGVTLADLAIGFGGPTHKWRVMHGQTVVRHGYENKEQAEEAAEKYLLTINS